MNSMLNLWLIPLLPLAGAAINGFLGKKSSRTAVSTIGFSFQRSGVCDGVVGGDAVFIAGPSLSVSILRIGSGLAVSALTSRFISINCRWSCCWW